MWRYFFLLFCSVITFVICGYITNLIQLILFFTVKQIKPDYYYKINYYLCYTFYSMVCSFGEWYADCELYVYMDKEDFKKYSGKEHMYLIGNHTGEIDWMFYSLLSEKIGLLGNGKFVGKNTIQYVPGFGLNLLISDFIFLHRNYQKDKKNIENKTKILMNYPSNIYLVLTPEGTRFDSAKHELSVKFAKERGLPILKHHLTPKTKAFTTSLPILHEKLKAVYDVTIAFKPDEVAPKFINMLMGKKIKGYFYIKRIPMEDVPKDEIGAATFIHNMFAEKDKLVDHLYKTGDFVTSDGRQIEKMKMQKNYFVLMNAIAWYTFSIGMVLYISIQLILNGYAKEFLTGVGVYIFFSIILSKVVASLVLLKSESK